MASAAGRSRIVHVCRECGTSHPKWAGRCAGCGDWNTLDEDVEVASLVRVDALAARPGPVRLAELGDADGSPTATSIPELDRVLGGGLVAGSVTLLGGEPGIGKSTLLLQVLARHDGPSLYVSAEESAVQVGQRAERLGLRTDDIWLHAEVSLERIVEAIDRLGPRLVVVDSIQTVADPALASLPGSVGQVRGCAQRLVAEAKTRGVSVILVGHVTKDGTLAGPRVLEHIVDTVLAFEGDRQHALRLVRATKHRFGSTTDLGVFEMTTRGLIGVADPSSVFLADRRTGIPGSVVVPTVDGQRPLVVEVQSLTSPGVNGVPPRRSALGTDAARLSMLTAVLARRGGVAVGNHDVYVSAVGGVKLSEPGLDLGVCLAVVSALHDLPLAADTAVFGEVGLGGEIRQVANAPRRIAEATRLGFRRVVVPANTRDDDPVAGIEVVRVATIGEAIEHTALAG